MKKINESVQFIQKKYSKKIEIAVVLGSGLGSFVKKLKKQIIIPYKDIPNFPICSVQGHNGQLVLGELFEIPIAILQGRTHMYEGFEADEAVFSLEVLSQLGAQSLLLTNSAGGINLSYKPGELVIIEDHINLTGRNPLAKPNNPSLGPRFPDMSEPYNQNINKEIEKIAKELSIPIHKGVYAGVLGPSYETPAEIKMIRTLGGDVVGMSTVIETIKGNHLGLKVACISCVTNMGSGIKKEVLTHEDVKIQANNSSDKLNKLLEKTIERQSSWNIKN